MLKDEDGSADLFCSEFQQKLKFSIQTISHSETVDMGGYSIMGLESLHDANQQALVFLIAYEGRTILYGTDLLDICDEVYEILKHKRIDILILDQTYGEGYNAGGHLDAGKVKSIIDKLREQGTVTDETLIYATHISHEGNNTHEKMQSLAEKHGYHVAYDGLVVTI